VSVFFFVALSYKGGSTMSDNNQTQRQGWTCPICGTVYSPDVKECPKCRKQEVIINSGIEIKKDDIVLKE